MWPVIKLRIYIWLTETFDIIQLGRSLIGNTWPTPFLCDYLSKNNPLIRILSLKTDVVLNEICKWVYTITWNTLSTHADWYV